MIVRGRLSRMWIGGKRTTGELITSHDRKLVRTARRHFLSARRIAHKIIGRSTGAA